MKSVNCAVCGSSDYKLLFMSKDYDWGFPGEFGVVKCSKCGFVFTNPRPEDSEIGDYYPDEYHPIVQKNGLSQEDKRGLDFFYGFRERFVKSFKKEGSLIDIGTGEGMFLKYLSDKGWSGELAGIEPTARAVFFAREKLKLNVMEGDLKSLHLESSRYDVVTMWEVMEHLPDLNENLKEIRRILKDDGVFVASVPNFASIQSVIFRRWWYGLKTPVHLSHFTPGSLRKIFANNGFKAEIHHSLINLKKPVTGYSDSLRYILTDFGFYPKRASMIKELSKNPAGAGSFTNNGLAVNILHQIEFLIFGAMELAGLPLGRTGTIFVAARKI